MKRQDIPDQKIIQIMKNICVYYDKKEAEQLIKDFFDQKSQDSKN